MSIVTDVVKGFFEPAKELISEFVVDKDQANQLQFELNKLFADSLNSARDHDKATYGIWLVDFIRGMIRPVITICFGALFVIAKLFPEKGIILTVEDYAMIGGVMAFWFGGKFLGKDIQK